MQRYIMLLLMLFSSPIYASNMGNGPATIKTWVIGGVLALMVSFFSSCKKNEVGELVFVNKKRFVTMLLIFMPIIFILGVLALFIFA